ncbi:MAG: hypothetical protein HOP12_14510 [Candidatus Eisenbacteria bacterium]|uniref:Uncharacterized protein n=1 Tax=Eiseniibacteriota bacterium TaxID=2212470 RepID=A0A849SNH4_UNCEI|nr:hypothetical protein [Candidatus Eisenbacteria bacterium]
MKLPVALTLLLAVACIPAGGTLAYAGAHPAEGRSMPDGSMPDPDSECLVCAPDQRRLPDGTCADMWRNATSEYFPIGGVQSTAPLARITMRGIESPRRTRAALRVTDLLHAIMPSRSPVSGHATVFGGSSAGSAASAGSVVTPASPPASGSPAFWQTGRLYLVSPVHGGIE